MTKQGKILIVDDNRAIRTALELLLPMHFEQVISISTPKVLMETLRKNPDLDLVLLDMNFHSGVNSGNEGLYWMREIRKARPLVSVVLFTAYADIALAVEAIKEGATDFIEKPWNNEKLIVTLKNGVELSLSNKKIRNLKSIKQTESTMYWGESSLMQNLRKMIDKVAPTDANILIVGENGTGKDLLAREIHAISKRSEEQIVNVDMGSITETLFESELFGHTKGAFTDAKAERIGKFEVASGGTLFLDEIGNIPLHLQSKLLTALQSRSIVRVGENTPRSVDIRLITATNADLENAVAEGRFREDLYYRINTFVLQLPPLRERGNDIVELATNFAIRYARKYGKKCEAFSKEAISKLMKHSWPGNIRELQHTIEKAIIICDNSQIEAEDLLLARANNNNTSTSTQQNILPLEELERSAIENAMRIHCGNISEVATQLGVTRQTLYNKLKKYNI
ncbi:MAG: sigma-54 dependent transcriptional regulator [Rikenellaceae bacterium]